MPVISNERLDAAKKSLAVDYIKQIENISARLKVGYDVVKKHHSDGKEQEVREVEQSGADGEEPKSRIELRRPFSRSRRIRLLHALEVTSLALNELDNVRSYWAHIKIHRRARKMRYLGESRGV